MPSTSSRTRKVALIGYSGAQSLDLVGPFEVFCMANRYAGRRVYDVMLASMSGGAITTNSGLRLAQSIALKALPRDLDTLLVAGGDIASVDGAAQGEIVDWLRSRAKKTRALAVCVRARLRSPSRVYSMGAAPPRIGARVMTSSADSRKCASNQTRSIFLIRRFIRPPG